MKQQHGYSQHTSATTQGQDYKSPTGASPHSVGHNAGLHPEDQQYLSDEVRRFTSPPARQSYFASEIDEKLVNEGEYDDVWPVRLPTST